ncbi:MAG: efflux RND transporter periplasmic adaptor subunit [Alphaproteobacteria bacterium]|nr:efflux RND transporter periplasmic adaptor subunit [Alphaproteobacteria bacterium]
MKHSLTIIALGLLLAAGSITLYTVTPAMAETGHDHADHDDHGHDDEKGHEHDDDHGDDHKDEDTHEHKEKSDDDHGEDDGHGHGDEHEEGRTEIDAEAAKAAGIVVRKVQPANIQDVLTLTGRIMLNRNTTADVRARFSGIVRSVKVNLGEKVTKGQVLATVEANESLRVYTITAPTDGVVLSRNTNIGNVAGGDALFTIADLSDVWAEFHVFPRDISKVRENQQVRVHTLENGKEVEAPVTLILPTADPLSQTVIAVVSIPNSNKAWRPGMTVEGDVHISEKRVPLAVTKEAGQRMENKTVVFVKEGDGYEMRPVKLGASDGKYIEIREGLKAGEQYVSQGSFIVKADIGKAAAKHEH